MGRVGEPIGAGGQQVGEAAGQERVPVGLRVRFKRKQHAAQPTGLARQQQVPTGLGLEARRIGEGASAGVEAVAQRRPIRAGDEPDRDRRRGAGHDESRVHGDWPVAERRPSITAARRREGNGDPD